MKLSHLFISIFYLALVALLSIKLISGLNTFSKKQQPHTQSTNEISREENEPNDWLYMQRSYPSGRIDSRAYVKAVAYNKEKTFQNKFRNGLLSKSWEFCGPTNMAGRITDIEMTDDLSTIFVGSASGGIFKSTDDGATWLPIFDDETSLSIGDIAIAHSDNKIIYVGTGEANAGGGSIAYDGNGVYKSSDGGSTWSHMGLDSMGSIGKVIIDPKHPDICFVAAMGYLFQNNEDRGLYRSLNGGLSWDKVLFINDSTGIIDIAINPKHPDTIFAAAWERVRRVNRRSYGGPSSGIFRSTDGGNTWKELTNGLPNSSGRIGIAIAESSPEILYACYTDATAGILDDIYKSVDNGETWLKLNVSGIIDAPYMWWFGKIFTDPNNAATVYMTSFFMYKSTDGGHTWNEIFSGSHVDQHTICVKSKDSKKVLLGNDGGAFLSKNGGSSYTELNGLPTMQFYTCEIDYTFSKRLYGGAQDNGILRTISGNINGWQNIDQGDGFKVLVDPSDNHYVYAEIQYGALERSTNGGSSFVGGTSGIGSQDRKNWNTPVIFNPLNPSTLYYGSNRLYKSTDRALSWTAISPDLTSHAVKNEIVYGTITAISVSPVNDDIIYIGTDDGNVQVTKNGGNTWTSVSSSLPDRWVTSVVADPNDENSACVTLSGFRFGEPIGHIYKTSNQGNQWSDISGDLPDIPINDLIVTQLFGTLIVATDIGVLYSVNQGLNWELLGIGLPNVVCTDLSIHSQQNTLLVATYGRGLFKINLDDINTSVTNIEEYNNLEFQVLPNPFSERTIIKFNVQKNMIYSLSVFNNSGVCMKTLCNKYLDKGIHEFNFEASQFPGGLYYCKIISADRTVSKIIKLIKC